MARTFVNRFFPYAGAKFRIAQTYPRPLFETLIEPFAGSAGYALNFPYLKVHLYDLDPVLYGVWDYLIRTPSEEIRKLPAEIPDLVDDLKVCQEAKWLIGFWCNYNSQYPCRRPHTMMKSGRYVKAFWGEYIRDRISIQQDFIRHWKVYHQSYETIPNQRATWFIDPPYQYRKVYRLHDIAFDKLATWSMARKGQVIVCEAGGANWLPFEHHKITGNTLRKYKDYAEVIYYQMKGKAEIKI